LRVNDRGPFVDGRIIDVSRRASQLLGFHHQGIAKVKVEILPDESRVLAGLAPDPSLRASTASLSPRTRNLAASAQGRSPAAEAGNPALEAGNTVQAAAYRPAEAASRHSARGASFVSAEPARTPTPAPTHTADSTRETASAERVEAKNLYVQAGAYSYVDSAESVRAQLRDVGPVTISAVHRDGRDLFRVRVGPLASEDEADRLLAAVVRAGFSSSRVVHE
jgi:rare lipoprotein A